MNMLRFPKRRASWLTAWGAAYGWPPLFLPLGGDGWRLFEKPLLLADVAHPGVGESVGKGVVSEKVSRLDYRL